MNYSIGQLMEDAFICGWVLDVANAGQFVGTIDTIINSQMFKVEDSEVF